ncbi:MAG: CinA family nicotinamide mononucleotide deamidase-related protein [Rikenellaceae bacterium]
MTSTIITIGDEILIGQIVDTNSTFIAKALSDIGFTVSEKCSISDSQEVIQGTIRRAMESSDLVVITGGLGPTNDDVTKLSLVQMFNSTLVENHEVALHVESMLAKRGVAFNRLNREQALVPDNCTVLHNACGTAPGMWFEQGEKVVVSLPGVPFEMKELMQNEVIPRLKKGFKLRGSIHRTLVTYGIAESILAERIEEWENSLPEGVKLAYLPNANRVRLRLSAYEVEGEQTAKLIDDAFNALALIIPDNILGWEGVSEEELIQNILTEKGLTLSAAESCTGGAIASRFTARGGASLHFLSGVVSYSNHSKVNILGVEESAIEQYGAVSEQVAIQMAQGVRRVSASHYAISTTGIAGPTGGSEEKPVGTVWIGVATPQRSYAILKNCGTERSQIIARATNYALSELLSVIRAENL